MKSLVRIAVVVAVSAFVLSVSGCKSDGGVKHLPASATFSVEQLSSGCKVDTDRNDQAVVRYRSPARPMPASCMGSSPSVWRAFVVADLAMLRRVFR